MDIWIKKESEIGFVNITENGKDHLSQIKEWGCKM